MRKQRTIKSDITASGVGVHCGKKCKVHIEPLGPNSGVTFYNEEHGKAIKLSWESVIDTQLATTIGDSGVRVRTVEHLMAALYGLGIDNVLVRVWGEEIPIMDGSSAPWVYLIKTAGIVELDEYKPVIIIKRPVSVRESGRFAAMIPSRDFSIKYSIKFDNAFVGKQRLDIHVTELTFVNEISKARTFGFLKDIEFLQANNMALGGSLDNAVVIDEYGIINDDPLRYEDEFVRHKILDAIGDLSVMGYDIKGKYIGYRSGHAINHKLVRTVLSDRKNYEVVGSPSRERMVESLIFSAGAEVNF